MNIRHCQQKMTRINLQKNFHKKIYFSKTISDTVNGITGNKIDTSTNEVDTPLLEDSNDNIKTNEEDESYREKLYNLISKCGCINIFNPNYFSINTYIYIYICTVFVAFYYCFL